MKTKNVIIAVVVVAVVLVAVGIWAGISIVGASQNPAGPSPYSAVYLTTGDIYYGKLSWFPKPHLTDAWVLQRTQDAKGQTHLSVAPFTSSFWSPVNEINLNPKAIVFWTRLRNDSKLAQAIENPSSIQSQNTQGSQIPASSTIPLPATSTKSGG